MVIGFAGSTCSGKSTTVQDVAFLLREKGHKIKVIEGVSERLFKVYSLTFGVRSLEDLRKREDLYLLFEQDWLAIHLEEIKKHREDGRILLCDRTAFDVLPYFLMHCRRSVDKAVFDSVLEKVRRVSEKPPYNVIFFLPPLKSVSENNHPIRASEDVETREAQAYIIKHFLPRSLTVPVETQDRVERAGYISFLIERWISENARK
ncbi:AAA family ATPase [Atrimonas thermophila]|uniref:AAA family ATPase n=1 Tax=Atrimonas thermophila TaxID=3064161 RepID=UPI00399C6C65